MCAYDFIFPGFKSSVKLPTKSKQEVGRIHEAGNERSRVFDYGDEP